HRPQSPAVLTWILEQAVAWPQVVINAYARSMRDIDHRERLGRIDCPTLIIQGRHDRKQRYEGAAYMASRIRGARLVTLEESAHMGEIEELNRFNAAVIDFLEEVQALERVAWAVGDRAAAAASRLRTNEWGNDMRGVPRLIAALGRGRLR